jgi:hypothetical protein
MTQNIDALVYTSLTNKITNDSNNYPDIYTNLQSKIGSNSNNEWNSIISETTLKRACCNNSTDINVKIPIPTGGNPGGIYSKYFFIEKPITVPTSMCKSDWNANYCAKFKDLYCANLFYNFRENLKNKDISFNMAIYPDWEAYRQNDCATFTIGDIPKVIINDLSSASCTTPNFWDTVTQKCYKQCDSPNLFADALDRKSCRNQILPPSNPPNPITVSSKESNSITLQFNTVAFADSYYYKFKTSSANSYNLEAIISATTSPVNLTIRDLQPNTNYDISVRSKNISGPSANWTEVTSVLTKPMPPTNITFTNISRDSVTMNWTTSGSNITYKIFQSTSQNFDTNPTYTITENNAISKVIIGLTPNTNYYFKIKASNASGDSVDSDLKQVLTNNLAPVAAPANTTNQSAAGSQTIIDPPPNFKPNEEEEEEEEEEKSTSYLIWIIGGVVILILLIIFIIVIFYMMKNNTDE